MILTRTVKETKNTPKDKEKTRKKDFKNRPEKDFKRTQNSSKSQAFFQREGQGSEIRLPVLGPLENVHGGEVTGTELFCLVFQ